MVNAVDVAHCYDKSTTYIKCFKNFKRAAFRQQDKQIHLMLPESHLGRRSLWKTWIIHLGVSSCCLTSGKVTQDAHTHTYMSCCFVVWVAHHALYYINMKVSTTVAFFFFCSFFFLVDSLWDIEEGVLTWPKWYPTKYMNDHRCGPKTDEHFVNQWFWYYIWWATCVSLLHMLLYDDSYYNNIWQVPSTKENLITVPIA